MQSSKYVILGGGMVAGYAAKRLAERGLASGELAIVSADSAFPYERPPLSKGFLSGKEQESRILISAPDWYKEKGIQVSLRTPIEAIDLQKKQLRAANGETFAFEKLLLATGCRSRKLNIPGDNLGGAFYLRSMDDSRKIREFAATAKNALVIGGGFIGMEVASVLAGRGMHATMVVREDRVWKKVFTPEMSAFFESYYAERGVDIVKNSGVAELTGSAKVEEARLSDGKKIACDMAVAGVGAEPVTELATKSGLAVGNGVIVNEYLEASEPGVYAAGDIAFYPDAIFEKKRRVEHWDNAVSQGQHWADVVSGDRKPFVHVPYFFSDVFDLSYELWGDADGADETVVRGDLKTTCFSVWWLKRRRVVAVFAMNRPDAEREAAPAWIQAKQNVTPERLGDNSRAAQEAI
jgi:NADPH-dependent 2,4-dienoyl-CoA reductase/sulfur reductase-like enzyme